MRDRKRDKSVGVCKRVRKGEGGRGIVRVRERVRG